jgi:hypothetical protein
MTSIQKLKSPVARAVKTQAFLVRTIHAMSQVDDTQYHLAETPRTADMVILALNKSYSYVRSEDIGNSG